jgi:hypothetical protein
MDFIVQRIVFFLLLSESCEEALEVFNRENLFPAMYTCMQHLVYGVELAVTVGQQFKVFCDCNLFTYDWLVFF